MARYSQRLSLYRSINVGSGKELDLVSKADFTYTERSSKKVRLTKQEKGRSGFYGSTDYVAYRNEPVTKSVTKSFDVIQLADRSPDRRMFDLLSRFKRTASRRERMLMTN